MTITSITIFTPTYNRGYILPTLYKSLLNQIDKNFEWVIVDDGSWDNTANLVSAWIKEDKISIKYIKQTNQGKHIAINTGVKAASGELFFIVDSDDCLAVDAIQKIRLFWEGIGEKEDIAGIISYRIFPNGEIVGSKLPETVKRCKLRDTTMKYHSFGDKVVIYRTDIFSRYKYPQFVGERFFGESYVFNLIDDEYDMAVMDEGMYIFDYQPDGLSQDFRKLYRENPKGMRFSMIQSLRYAPTLISKIHTAAHIGSLSLHLRDIKTYIKTVSIPILLSSILPSIILYYKIFIRKESDVKPFKESSGR